MKNLTFHLAAAGIKSNRKIYIPYILSCIGMVMMLYIVYALSCSPAVASVRGGNNVAFFLALGKFVIIAFSFLFLMYTNSFVTKQRWREFGLYGVLGMDSKSLGKIAACESLVTAAAGLGAGLGLGVLLSKIAELCLLNAVHSEIVYDFTFIPEPFVNTLICFGIIFFFLGLKSVHNVKKYRPAELIRLKNAGEKPPKGNLVTGIAGVVLLCIAYYYTSSITSPLTAIVLFFVAAAVIVVATYLIFVSGSVALCRRLQKTKRYYYRKNHFISVSNMAYRMKRNGAGLASTCVIATIVLVMICSSACLYFGENELLASRFKRDSELVTDVVSCDGLSGENTDMLVSCADQAFEKTGISPENVRYSRYAHTVGAVKGTQVNLTDVDASVSDYENVTQLYFISCDDYNEAVNDSVSLEGREVLLYEMNRTYDYSFIDIAGTEFTVRGKTDSFPEIYEAEMIKLPTLMFVVSDFKVLNDSDSEYTYYGGKGEKSLTDCFSLSFDMDDSMTDEEKAAAHLLMKENFAQAAFSEANGYTYERCSNMQSEKHDFYSTFGGLFFIGVLLSVVFLFAACVILYFKQLTEGYEDRQGFSIMRKVGLNAGDIKATVNSQMLTVFFTPLILAGLHLVFVFPMIWNCLTMFGLDNYGYAVLVFLICFACFAVFYFAVYRLTSKQYCRIVSKVTI